MSFAQKSAVKAHELGHAVGHHTEWRLLTLLLCPILFFWVCRKQELLADKHAAKLGCTNELIEFLEQHPCSGRRYPSNNERINALRRIVPVTDTFA